MHCIIHGRGFALKLCLVASVVATAQSASARNYLGAYLPSPPGSDQPGGQVEYVTAQITVPASPGPAPFRSYTANLQGNNYIVQSVLATTFDNGQWDMHAELYDAQTGGDQQWIRHNVNPGDTLVLTVVRLGANLGLFGNYDSFQIQVNDTTAGTLDQVTVNGPRIQESDATALIMSEWDDVSESCRNWNGVSFTKVHVWEVPTITYPWTWNHGIVEVPWYTGDTQTFFQPDSSPPSPNCAYVAGVFYFPTLHYGALGFNAQ